MFQLTDELMAVPRESPEESLVSATDVSTNERGDMGRAATAVTKKAKSVAKATRRYISRRWRVKRTIRRSREDADSDALRAFLDEVKSPHMFALTMNCNVTNLYQCRCLALRVRV